MDEGLRRGICFGSCGEVFDLDGWEFGSDHDGVGGAFVFCGLELFSDLFAGSAVVGAKACIAEELDDGEGIVCSFRCSEDDERVEGGGGGEPRVALGESGWGFLDQVGEDDIAHAESEGGKPDASVAHGFDEGVVAAATGECALIFCAIEHFEDHAGVVREAANDGQVGLDIVA